jgi:hypothetical protein
VTSRSRGALRPSLHLCFAPKKSEGAGKTGCALHPRSRVQLRTENAHTSIQVQREHPGLPCAVALRLTSCSPRRTALLPPSPPRDLLLGNLTPAPRRQDHTTSPYASCASSLAHSASTAPRTQRRDDRETPLLRARDGRDYSDDLPDGQSGIFFRERLDSAPRGTKLICPSGNVVGWAKRSVPTILVDERWWARRKCAFVHPTKLCVRTMRSATSHAN